VTCGYFISAWDIDTYRAEFFHPTWTMVAGIRKRSSGPGVFSGGILIYRPGM